MTPTPDTGIAPQRSRAALAAYLRLLAACLQDEADMIEQDAVRSDEVMRRFRDGVLALSLEDAPLDLLLERIMPAASAGDQSISLPGTPTQPATPSKGDRRARRD